MLPGVTLRPAVCVLDSMFDGLSFFLPCRRFCMPFHVVFPEALKRPSYWFKPTPAVSAENAVKFAADV